MGFWLCSSAANSGGSSSEDTNCEVLSTKRVTDIVREIGSNIRRIVLIVERVDLGINRVRFNDRIHGSWLGSHRRCQMLTST